MEQKKWHVKQDEIKDDALAREWGAKRTRSLTTMQSRTSSYPSYVRVSHGATLLDRPWADGPSFSEGTTQAIKRKIRAQSLQRVPDGNITTQYDKNSIEQIEIEMGFEEKVMTSEYANNDILKWLWKLWNNSWDFGFGCNRSGFERDLDGDVRVSRRIIQWNDIYPDPDCDSIEEAEWYLVREYVSRAELEQKIDCETGELLDATYNELTLKYLIENNIKDATEINSMNLADRKKGVTNIESIQTWTVYRRGDDEFITFVPSINAELRRVKNYDPRKDVPLHFLILEPDTEFPLGTPSVMWTLGHQQVADSLQALAYTLMHLAMDPPIKARGTIDKAKIKYKPRAWWDLGTNPSNNLEPERIESQTLVSYGSIAENIAGQMLKTMNAADSTVASDAMVMNYSGTPQGVEAQRQDKTVTINQYQKRIEVFFADWANYALRSYFNSCTGIHEITVDEETRRKIWDIEASQEAEESIIVGDKIKVDFDKISTGLLSFKVRTGSLVQSAKEQQRKDIQEMLIPLSQMLGNISEENRKIFEDNIIQLVARLFELSDIDMSQQAADRFNDHLLMGAMQATMERVMQQDGRLAGIEQALAMPGQPMEQGMPQEPGPLPQQGMPSMPMPQQQPPIPPGVNPLPLAQVSTEFPMPEGEVPIEPDESV